MTTLYSILRVTCLANIVAFLINHRKKFSASSKFSDQMKTVPNTRNILENILLQTGKLSKRIHITSQIWTLTAKLKGLIYESKISIDLMFWILFSFYTQLIQKGAFVLETSKIKMVKHEWSTWKAFWDPSILLALYLQCDHLQYEYSDLQQMIRNWHSRLRNENQ